MFGRKGQGTTEYLIILAVVIVIALVVVAVMGWMPGMGSAVTDQASRSYWSSTYPVAIVDWDISSSQASFVIQNMSQERVEITAITLDGTAVGVTDANIMPGAKATFSGTGVTCTTGNRYSYNVIITYNTPNLTGQKLTGDKPVVGICS
jgi:hypothetical protein